MNYLHTVTVVLIKICNVNLELRWISEIRNQGKDENPAMNNAGLHHDEKVAECLAKYASIIRQVMMTEQTQMPQRPHYKGQRYHEWAKSRDDTGLSGGEEEVHVRFVKDGNDTIREDIRYRLPPFETYMPLQGAGDKMNHAMETIYTHSRHYYAIKSFFLFVITSCSKHLALATWASRLTH